MCTRSTQITQSLSKDKIGGYDTVCANTAVQEGGNTNSTHVPSNFTAEAERQRHIFQMNINSPRRPDGNKVSGPLYNIIVDEPRNSREESRVKGDLWTGSCLETIFRNTISGDRLLHGSDRCSIIANREHGLVFHKKQCNVLQGGSTGESPNVAARSYQTTKGTF